MTLFTVAMFGLIGGSFAAGFVLGGLYVRFRRTRRGGYPRGYGITSMTTMNAPPEQPPKSS